LFLRIYHTGGDKEEIVLKHSYGALQIQWFKAGSALNFLKQKH
jgi:aconitate hydratase